MNELRVMDFHMLCDVCCFARLDELPPYWPEHLTLPSCFSKERSEAIKSGVLTKRARVEIHNALATLMLVHTSRPTSNDRDIVCRRLVQKYPTLKDSSDTGYVSLLFFPHLIYLLVYGKVLSCEICVCVCACTY